MTTNYKPFKTKIKLDEDIEFLKAHREEYESGVFKNFKDKQKFYNIVSHYNIKIYDSNITKNPIVNIQKQKIKRQRLRSKMIRKSSVKEV